MPEKIELAQVLTYANGVFSADTSLLGGPRARVVLIQNRGVVPVEVALGGAPTVTHLLFPGEETVSTRWITYDAGAGPSVIALRGVGGGGDVLVEASDQAQDFVSPLPWSGGAGPGGSAGAGALPFGYISGFEHFPLGISDVEVGPGGCRDSADGANIILAAPQSASMGLSGAGGLDTGTPAANTPYALYIIADTSAVEPTLPTFSLSFSAPTLPAGYDVFRLVGHVVTDTSADLRDFVMDGVGRYRRYSYLGDRGAGVAADGLEVLTTGVAATWTVVPLAPLAPPTARRATLFLSNGGAAQSRLRTIGQTGTGGSVAVGAVASDWVSDFRIDAASQEVEYEATATGNLTVQVLGVLTEV